MIKLFVTNSCRSEKIFEIFDVAHRANKKIFFARVMLITHLPIKWRPCVISVEKYKFDGSIEKRWDNKFLISTAASNLTTRAKKYLEMTTRQRKRWLETTLRMCWSTFILQIAKFVQRWLKDSKELPRDVQVFQMFYSLKSMLKPTILQEFQSEECRLLDPKHNKYTEISLKHT